MCLQTLIFVPQSSSVDGDLEPLLQLYNFVVLRVGLDFFFSFTVFYYSEALVT